MKLKTIEGYKIRIWIFMAATIVSNGLILSPVKAEPYTLPTPSLVEQKNLVQSFIYSEIEIDQENRRIESSHLYELSKDDSNSKSETDENYRHVELINPEKYKNFADNPDSVSASVSLVENDMTMELGQSFTQWGTYTNKVDYRHSNFLREYISHTMEMQYKINKKWTWIGGSAVDYFADWSQSLSEFHTAWTKLKYKVNDYSLQFSVSNFHSRSALKWNEEFATFYLSFKHLTW